MRMSVQISLMAGALALASCTASRSDIPIASLPDAQAPDLAHGGLLPFRVSSLLGLAVRAPERFEAVAGGGTARAHVDDFFLALRPRRGGNEEEEAGQERPFHAPVIRVRAT